MMLIDLDCRKQLNLLKSKYFAITKSLQGKVGIPEFTKEEKETHIKECESH